MTPALPRFSLMLILLLPGCSGQVAHSEQDCIDTYAIKAPSPKATGWAYSLCREAYRPETTPERRKVIACALPKIATAGSELGAELAIRGCMQD